MAKRKVTTRPVWANGVKPRSIAFRLSLRGWLAAKSKDERGF